MEAEESKHCSCTRRQFVRRSCALASLALLSPAPGCVGRAPFPALGPFALEPPASVYPDDAFSRPFAHKLIAFETMMGVSLGGTLLTRPEHFFRNELHLAEWDGKTCTRWSVQTRDTDTWPLVIQETIRRRPEAVSFWVRNDARVPMTFFLHYGEHAWIPKHEKECTTWFVGEGKRVEPGAGRELHFSFAAVHRATESNHTEPVFPGSFTLYARGFQPNETAELLLKDLTIHYPAAPGIRVQTLDCSPKLRAGARASFSLALNGTAGDPIEGRALDIEVRKEEHVIWRVRLTAEERAHLRSGVCRIKRVVPTWLPPGELVAGFVAGGYRVKGAEAHFTLKNPLKPGFPRAERRLYNGRPTFVVNGKPTPWQGYASADYQPGNIAEFGASGANVFCVTASAGRRLNFSSAAPTWLAPGVSDYGQIDEWVCMSLQANPDAMIFLRLHFALPPFWDQAHEEELVRMWTPQGPVFYEEESTTRVGALASEVWRRDQAQALRELIRHCKEQPWAGRLAGFWVDGETTEEWFAYGSNDGLFADYSQPNQDGFAHWLAERGMDKSLAVPNPDVRKHPGSDLYLPGHDGQWAAAYNQYYSDLTADTIGYFARIVKEETEGRCLAGTFYGYVIQLAGEPRQTLAAHASLRKVLDDPNVDFLGGIPLHNYRRLDGYSAFVSATESILAAGKLYVNENDLFSWLHPWHWNTEYNPKDPRRGVVFMHRREIANQAVHGAVGQWFSLQTSWHHDKALQADFARQIRLQAQSLRYDRSSVAEIAFMVDDTTFSWTPPESVLPGLCNVQLLYSLAKTGTPVDVWLLSDLDRLPERIRFIVIANAAAAYPRDIAKLEALVRQGGKTIVAVGAPGLVDPTNGAWRSERPAEVLGLPIRVDDAALPGNIALNESGAPVASFGASPRPRARVEGEGFLKYPDGACAGTERPLHTGGRLIWCGMPPLSVSLLRGWLERAGVHCYAPPECFVYAARELVSITSPIEGDVNIEWPRDVHVEDLFDGWRGSGRSIRCPFELGQTRLFHVKPRMP